MQAAKTQKQPNSLITGLCREESVSRNRPGQETLLPVPGRKLFLIAVLETNCTKQEVFNSKELGQVTQLYGTYTVQHLQWIKQKHVAQSSVSGGRWTASTGNLGKQRDALCFEP